MPQQNQQRNKRQRAGIIPKQGEKTQFPAFGTQSYSLFFHAHRQHNGSHTGSAEPLHLPALRPYNSPFPGRAAAPLRMRLYLTCRRRNVNIFLFNPQKKSGIKNTALLLFVLVRRRSRKTIAGLKTDSASVRCLSSVQQCRRLAARNFCSA